MNICQKYILNEGVCNTGDGLPGSALVMIAVGVTVVVVLGLTLFAFQTKWDFTGAAPYMVVALLCLLMFGLIGGIWLRRYWTFNIIYAILGTLLFSFYLVFEVIRRAGPVIFSTVNYIATLSGMGFGMM